MFIQYYIKTNIKKYGVKMSNILNKIKTIFSSEKPAPKAVVAPVVEEPKKVEEVEPKKAPAKKAAAKKAPAKKAAPKKK